MTDVERAIAPIRIRALTADDAPAVVELHESLDQHDGYLRFLAARPKNLAPLVSRLAAVDRRHGAVGAFDAGELVGVANLVVLDDPETAEIAMIVRHDHQLHGIGTTLLARLAEMARERGIRTLVAEVLLENVTMLKVIDETGLPTTRSREGSVVHVEIALSRSH
ncbi:N-acetyltransferase family protein [Rhodococcus sp. NPDC003348]